MDSGIQFPPGFRFHPSDEELIVHYLQNKLTSHPLPASIIAEIDLYKYNPWELPKKALFGEEEWYFFSPRERKYPNGTRPNRAAGSGYWKATGTDKPIVASGGSNSIGVKKALVFYIGRPPKGTKTEWIMNEYRLPDTTLIRPSMLRGSMRLDDWVLCRVRKRGGVSRTRGEVQDRSTTETVTYIPDTEEGWPTYTISNADLVVDHLYKDCRLLASILAGHFLPPNETNSNVIVEESNKVNSFMVNQDSSNRQSSQTRYSSLDSQTNPLKRKSNEKNVNGNLFATNNRNKKLDSGNRYDMNHYNQNFISSYPPEPIINFQEFNEIAFRDRCLH